MDFSQTCLPVYGVIIPLPRVALLCRMILLWGSYSFERVAGLGRVILPVSHLSPTVSQYALGTLGRIISTVASPSRCCAPHDAYMCLLLSCFALFPNTYLSSTCLPPVAALDGRIWLVSRLFPISVCVAAGLGRKTSFASACLPLLFLSWGCLGTDEFSLSPCCLLLVSLCCSWNGRISLGYHLSPIFPTSFPLLSPACFRIAFVLDLFFPPTVPWRATVQRWYIFFGGDFFFKLADDTDPPRLVGSIQWTFMSVTEEKVVGCL